MTNNITNYAIQFAITAGVAYFLGTTDTGSLVQMGVISVLSSVAADQITPMISSAPTA